MEITQQEKVYEAVPIKNREKETFTDTLINHYNKLPPRDKVLVKSAAIVGVSFVIGFCSALNGKK